MCYVEKLVFTVCAHTRAGNFVECSKQTARKEQWGNSGCCPNFQLYVRSCRPTEKVELKYGFCDDCSEHYKDYDIRSVDAILNYWAFKNISSLSLSFSACIIPGCLVFGENAPIIEDYGKPRSELVALDKAWPRVPHETRIEWLRRLEKARTVTLELAQTWTREREERDAEERLKAAAARAAAREAAAARDDGVVGMQPRLARPMSVQPYDSAVGSVVERNEIPESDGNSLPDHDARSPPQIHLETFQKLCGEAPSIPLPRWPVEPSNAGSASLVPPLTRHLTLSRNNGAAITESEVQNYKSISAWLEESDSSVDSGSIRATSGIITISAELSQGSADKGMASSPEDSHLDGERLASIDISESSSKRVMDGLAEPNMTSHFSVSERDPMEMETAPVLSAHGDPLSL